MSGVVTRTPGAVGYADVAYALANKLQFAAVQNKSGKCALPGIRGIKAAAANERVVRLAQLPLDREPAEGQVATAYPICTYTYVILPLQSSKAAALKAFVNWAITSGQPLGRSSSSCRIPSYVARARQG